MSCSKEGCPSYSDLLWFVANVTHTANKRIAIEQHIKLCERCKNTFAAMNQRPKEDEEVCRQIDALPFSTLKERFEKALAEDNAAEMTVIVERLGETAKLCVDLLTIAAIKAPGIARLHAKEFFDDIRVDTLLALFPLRDNREVSDDDWD